MDTAGMPREIREKIAAGTVIPAIPLALNSRRGFDERRQKALVRYYIDAGSGGIAIGVHTTQFAIRDPEHGLFKPVLSFVSRAIDEHAAAGKLAVVKVGGICGGTGQALEIGSRGDADVVLVHSRKAERPPRYPRQGRPQDNPVGGEPTRLESPGYPITNATTERSMHLSETASSGSLRPRQMVPLLNRLKSINPLA